MANTIEILINAKDAASSVIKSVSNSAQDLGQTLTSAGASLTAIGLPFLGVATAAIKSYADSETQLSQLESVLKSTGGAAGVTKQQALDLAAGFQKVTKFSDETVLASENMLLTFTNIGKDVFPQATKTVLDMSQALGQDTKTSAIQLGKALNAPIEGTAALAKVGVKFTQAQKDMIKALTESGDVAGAQAIILKELQTEFGGSAEAAGKTFAGQVVILKNRIDDLLEGIGEKLIPIVSELIGWIGKAVDWFASLDENTKNIIVGAIAFGAALAVIGPIIAAIGVGITAVVGAIGALGSIIGIIFSPIGLLIGIIVVLYKAFQDNFLGIRDFLQPIFDTITNFFSRFNDNVKLYGSLILLYAQYYFQGVVTAIQTVIDKITDFLIKNPQVVEAIVVVGGFLLVLGGILLAQAVITAVFTGAMTALGIVMSIGSTLLTGVAGFIALLTGPVGLVALLVALVAAVMIGYPGGFPGLLKDAANSFGLLVKIVDMVFLNWIRDLAKSFHDLAVELGLATDASGKWKDSQNTNFSGGGQTTGGTSGGGGRVFGYALGTDFVPNAGLAFLHRGERVLTANENANFESKGPSLSFGNITIMANDAQGGKDAADAFWGQLDDLMQQNGVKLR